MRRSASVLRLAVACCGILAIAAVVNAQPATYRFSVGQQFSAAGKTLPAGQYEIAVVGSGAFVLRGQTGRVTVPVITRIARLEPSTAPAHFVFDKLNTGEMLLSEVWLPGEDGYVVCTLEKEHHHVMVKADK